ncbi:AAA family ATPase [Chitinophaga niabensis]|uniref:AAA family ATPase n=1 Tax=Chitinophaga niabensis TaxID=536979 RepID=UPI0031BB8613
MRIAVSGTHYTGKTTLIEDLIRELPNYEIIEEPYYQLEERGYQFAYPPSLEDFERQFLFSLQSIKGSGENVFLDRSPLDFIAYALSIEKAFSFDLNSWLNQAMNALAKLELILFVPIDNSISVPKSENNQLRFDVDERLREMLIDDCFSLDLNVMEVTGTRQERVKTVLRYLL